MAYETPIIELIEINPTDIMTAISNGEDNNFPIQ